jgi:hypothetical protein
LEVSNRYEKFYYNKVIWHHIAAFSDIFNDMQVHIYDAEGKAVGTKQVPVYLAPKEKVVAALMKGNWDQNPNQQGIQYENYLPSISIVWNGVSLDAERMKGQRDKRRLYVEYADKDEDGCDEKYVHTDIQTVPYKLNFEVTLWAKYMDDLAQLLENILPFFHPEAYISLYEKGVGSERKCKVVKESENLNFVYELNQPDRRVLQATISFNMECNFYKPENPIDRPIQKMYLNIGQPQANNKAFGEQVVVFSATSGGACFADIEENLRSFIKEFKAEDEFYISQYYDEVSGLPIQPNEMKPLHIPQGLIDSMNRRDPKLGKQDAFGVVNTTIGSQTVTVTDSRIRASSIVSAYVVTPNGNAPLNVTVTDVNDGNIVLTLSNIPTSTSYKVVWRAEIIGDLVVDIPIGSNTITIVDPRVNTSSIPIVDIYNTTDEDNISISGILSINNGNFVVQLSDIPQVNGYKLVWSVES